MRHFPTWTICSKHWRIETIIERLSWDDPDNEDYKEILELIKNCLDDWNRMEEKLKERKKQVEELENEKYYLEKQIKDLESDLDQFNNNK